jgi:hypothetical protein
MLKNRFKRILVALDGSANVVLRNVCSSAASLKAGDSIAVIVYDK